MRIGIGAGIADDGVTDVLIFGFDGWAPTEHRPEADEMFVVGVPFDVRGMRMMIEAMEKLISFLETGEIPDTAEPM